MQRISRATLLRDTRRHGVQLTHGRSLHQMPLLRTGESGAEHGIQPVFSPAAFKLAWADVQQLHIDALNRVAAGTEYESMALIKTIAQTARQPTLAPVYNHAALAFSNHFFFDALRPAPATDPAETTPQDTQTQQQPLPEAVARRLQSDFGGLAALEEHVSAIASAMTGCGWVWVVLDETNTLKVLATYNAGTPFDFGRLQRQDGNTGVRPDEAAATTTTNAASSSNEASASAPTPPAKQAAPTEEVEQTALYKSLRRPYALTPVLALSLWQHAYLHDFGVAGKDEYVRALFKAIDWSVVDRRIQEAQ